MESTEEEEDLKLAKASAGLLSDLENNLPKLLWKRPKTTTSPHGPVHSRVRRKDLDYIVNLIEPFQGEPQLLDAKLKYILPPIVEGYLEYLMKPSRPDPGLYLDLETALATILYTLCKVRGPKVIVGFFDNQPRHLELILGSLEHVSTRNDDSEKTDWKVPYILLLWLSHLLLAPFDLASISSQTPVESKHPGLQLRHPIPSIAQWIINLGLSYLPTSTKAQDAAASMLVRLSARPDMQKLQLADSLVSHAITHLTPAADTPANIYTQLGPLRFLSTIPTHSDLAHLTPFIYRACTTLVSDPRLQSPISTNAVGKRLLLKTLRNISLLVLRTPSPPLTSFLETSTPLEDTIDTCLTALADRDTPVRYASAKALSSLILALDPELGHEVIQALLDTFREDMPRGQQDVDYGRANALKWHGLTLALAHALFKRSAAPEQLPEIVEALVSALGFEQRTATGGSVGTNVRDAANFGIWSLARRYTTSELLHSATAPATAATAGSTIRALATHLLLSATLDPAGNIRRGSSAALQELTGRHPNQIVEGIALVQIVDYQAVGLRRRALVDVARSAAELGRGCYWTALVDGLLGWRGLGAPDVLSRRWAADSLASLAGMGKTGVDPITAVLDRISAILEACPRSDLELHHGLALAFARLMHLIAAAESNFSRYPDAANNVWQLATAAGLPSADFTPRALRAELPVAVAELAAAVCLCSRLSATFKDGRGVPDEALESFTQHLLARSETAILETLPFLVQQLLLLKANSSPDRVPLDFLDAEVLAREVEADSTKATLNGAGRAIALGALAPCYKDGLTGTAGKIAVGTLTKVVRGVGCPVDRRILTLGALTLALSPPIPAPGAISDLPSSASPGASPQTLSPPNIGVVELLIPALLTALQDHTIDSRGDIGSHARLHALSCTALLLPLLGDSSEERVILEAAVVRLSVEKLDRVRVRAASVRARHLPPTLGGTGRKRGEETGVGEGLKAEDVSGLAYWSRALAPLAHPSDENTVHKALLTGVLSTAGSGNETLLVPARYALASILSTLPLPQLHSVLSTFLEILKGLLVPDPDLWFENRAALQQPALSLLTFLLDTGIPQRLAVFPPHPSSPDLDDGAKDVPPYKWKTLLSTVQKMHFKSQDLPKLLAALGVYRGLAEVKAVRGEVVKKVEQMAKGNPFAIVKAAAGDVLAVIKTGNSGEAKEIRES